MTLPVNAYCLVQSDSHDQLLVEGGTIQQDGSRLVSQQTYSNGQCAHVSIGREVLAS